MTDKIIARWQDWSATGLEHLVLTEEPDGILAESAIVASVDGEAIGVRYRIQCDSKWRVRKAGIARVGDAHTIHLASDGTGTWLDGNGVAQPRLDGAIDIDISVTPFTNTLPIRRLNLKQAQSVEILVVYILLPGLEVLTDRQRYTRLGEALYRYESVDSDFTRDIEVDRHGLVTNYPGLFRRML